VDLRTQAWRRFGAVVWAIIRLAIVVGVPVWVSRRIARQPADPCPNLLCDQIERLVAADEAMAQKVDLRLRSLEETTARAEAEVRFMATLLGEGPAARTAEAEPDQLNDRRPLDRPTDGERL
jgi:hypothetical protein